ncbi:hypothetical protein [Aminobacter ciceronei]|uniref:Uncharacterized protein n=1 Tax=Aminobacter ciceronei TaxID=150723 RepID=A0ABR6C9R1_9HYPH|nr:hypothetical protein [Aminobacter ciceronei]MBA8907569.1 hypothetical protein [Aminobacter ciceronei]MBA9021330.1 hypothetical protein [Aminobacter ciceronei]
MMRAIWNGTVIAESAKTEIAEGNISFPPEVLCKEFFRQTDQKGRDRRHAGQEAPPIDVRDRRSSMPIVAGGGHATMRDFRGRQIERRMLNPRTSHVE